MRCRTRGLVSLVVVLLAHGAPAFAQDAASPSQEDDARAADTAPVVESSPSPAPTTDGMPTDTGGAFDAASLEELLGQSVVTASGGRAEDRSVAAANVFSISRPEIIAHGWKSLAEILANVPGLYIIDDLAESSISVRGVSGGLGAGSRIVKIMINGVPLSFRSNLHAFLGPEFIPVETIQRVEVAKGPLSSVYGANAFLATVNVITRSPLAGVASELAGRGELIRDNVGYGGSGMVTYGSAVWDITAAYRQERVDRSGLRVRETFTGQRERFPEFFDDESRDDIAAPKSLFGQVRRLVDGVGQFTLQGGLQELNSSGEFQVNSVLTHETKVALVNRWLDLRYEREIRGIQVRAHVGTSGGAPTHEDLWQVTAIPDSVYERNFKYRALDAGLDVETDPLPGLTVGAGVDASWEDHRVLYYTEILRRVEGTRLPGDRVDQVSDSNRREITVRNIGPHAHVAYSPPFLPELRVSLDGRLDSWNLFDVQYSYRGAASYRLPKDFVIKVVGGRAYQTPSPDLLYGVAGFGSLNNITGSRVLGGRDLTPQNVKSIEFELAGRIGDRVRFDIGTYGQRVDDLIEFEYRGSNFYARNQERIEAGGFEGDVRAEFDVISFYARASAAWKRERDTVSDETETGMGAPLFPTYWATAGGTFRFWPAYTMVTTQVRAVGARGSSSGNTVLNNVTPYELDSYVTADIFLASLGLHVLSENLETRITVGAKNVFDARWSEPGFGGFDIPNVGRVWSLEIRQMLGQ